MNTLIEGIKQMLKPIQLTKTIILTAMLLLGGMTAKARDYVITYTTGGTTYYLGMNGNSLASKTTFDPTCVWTCYNGNNEANLGNNSYSLRNKNNSSAYLTTSCNRSGSYWSGYTYTWTDLTIQSNASNLWRSSNGVDGNVYAYYSSGGIGSWNRSASIHVNTLTMQDNDTDDSQNYQVTTSQQDPVSTNPTITGADLLTTTGNSTYTASGAAFQIGYTNYRFNSTDHYIDENGNSFTGTPSPATIGTYTWNLTSNDYATLSTNTGSPCTLNVTSLPQSDVTLTLTVTVPATGGNPAAPANTTLSDSKTITIQGTKPSAPIITVSGNTVTLSTNATGTTTIRYTLDGTDPTASTGTVYDGTPIDLSTSTTSPVIVKAVTVRNNVASTVAEETVTLTLPEPVITVNADAGTATISCSVSGATIYYTTNGSTPTTSSSQYSGTITGLTMMQTIKAIAVKDGWNDSPVASATVTIPSGISDGVVTLFDCEPHSWAYYSDSECPVRSLSPADVKITYYGNGIMMTNNDDYTAGTTNIITSSSDDWKGSVAVGVTTDEAQNTFVYYKTLERAANTDDAWTFSSSNQSTAAARCSYTTIPNPFQKRPTYKEDANTKWRGFQCWRLKSVTNGKVFSANSGGTALATNAIINAETEFFFAPDNEYGMEVELEAVWARAYVKTGNANTLDANNTLVTGLSGGSYERNFFVITGGDTDNNINKTQNPVTISCRYPDGTSGGSLNSTIKNNFTANAVTKFEYVKLNASTFSANGIGLIIGRDCTGSVTNIHGATSAPSSSFVFRIESGDYTTSYLLSSVNGVSSGITINATYGCDYDRANNNTNTNLTFSNVVEAGYGSYMTSANGKINMTALSGTYGTNAANHEFYIGFENGGGGTSQAVRTLEVYGGVFNGGIAGGYDRSGNSASSTKVKMHIRGGTIQRYLYGAGQYSECSGARRIIITGGTFNGWIAGGAYGTDPSGGATDGNINLYFGGRASQTNTDGIFGAGYGTGTYASGQNYYTVQVSNVVFADEASTTGSVYGGGNNGFARENIQVYVAGGSVGGNVFGGANKAPSSKDVAVVVTGGTVTGNVYGGSNTSGDIDGDITVDIYGTDPAPSADAYALGGVFGGGNQAPYNGKPIVTVHNCGNSIEYVYGGGNAATVTGTDVTIYGGNKIGNVFGGCYGANVTANGTDVKIYGGTIGRVFGGNNSSGSITGTINVTVNKQADTDPNGSSTACDMKIGEVYGGGNLAGSAAGNITIGCTGDIVAGENGHAAHPENIGTTLEGIGYVYGGANQAYISSDISLTMESGIVGNLFGGNNTSGTISGGIQVQVVKDNNATCATNWYLGNVFGSGNLATYTIPSGKTLAVKVLHGTVSGNVYGGGKGVLVDGGEHGNAGKVTGSPQVTIGDNVSGHTAIVLGDVYGGGDAATVLGTPVIVVNDCNTEIGYLYGGGNAADVNGTNITFNEGTVHHSAFGGGHGDKNASNPSKYADVNGNVVFNVYGGTIDQVFAGSNSKGEITGTAALTINKTGTCAMKIREVYGGGNEAAGNAGTVNIGCTGALESLGTGEHYGIDKEGIQYVYGGANQADINGNITLNINSGIVENVFGGNNQSGTISGNIQVNIDSTGTCGWYVGDVFGGGNLADYSGTPDVNIIAGTVSGSVFGGGNAADVGGSDVAVSGGQINGGVYGGCNSSGDAGPVVISLTGGQVGTSGTRADVFGGGFGENTTTSSDITVTLNGTTVYGDLYGGSALGSVNDDAAQDTTLVNLNSATLYGSIYGGGKGQVGPNSTDSITATSKGKAIVNIDVYDQYLTGIYGGAYINGNVKGDITVNVNANVGQDADHTLNVFGGGFGQATETEGDVTVNFGTEDGSKTPVIYGNVYGGSAQGQVGAGGKNTTVYIYNGTVNGNVFGGGLGVKNASGDYNAGTYVVANDSIQAVVNGDALVYIGTAAQTSGNNVVITGNVFGGSDLCGNTLGDITVHVYKTKHTTANTVPDQSVPTVTSVEQLAGMSSAAENYALQGVYGGGNLAHYTSTGDTSTKKATVHVHGCDNSIRYLYGGGNAANTTADSLVVDGGRFDMIFGGGNGAVAALPGANVTNGNATTYIYGGLYNYIFGGSNTKGNIHGEVDLNIDPDNGCGRLVAVNLFGGGNEAPGAGGNLTLHCGDLVMGDVYGGANKADITGDVTLTIEGGTLNNVFGGSKGVLSTTPANIDGNVTLNLKGGTVNAAFGGSDQNGNITGIITVNINEDETLACPLVVDTIYGAGNLTAYTPNDSVTGIKPVTPIVNFQHMKRGNAVNYDVFGGGLGTTATVTANPKVIIGGTESTKYAKVGRNVYGGGSKAPVVGSTRVIVRGYAAENDSIVGSVFGGGSQAGVSGTSTVQIANGTVTSGIYGGCNTSGTVGGAINVYVNGGTIGSSSTRADGVFGGGFGQSTETGSDVTVTIGNSDATPIIYGDVYGGSAKGKVNSSSASPLNTTKVWLKKGTITGDIYGGGYGLDNVEALVYGNVQVIVDGGTVNSYTVGTDTYGGRVFGCNNVKGTPKGTVEVTVNATNASSGSGNTKVYALQGVYGGGNVAGYVPTTTNAEYPKVTVNGCASSIKDVYGGGNAAPVPNTKVVINGGDIKRVFAGGNGESGTPAHVGWNNIDGTPTTDSYGAGIASAVIKGGTIEQVFGGSNANGVIRVSSSVDVDKSTVSGACDMKIGEVYGGGNLAAGKAGSITIGCTGTLTSDHSSHPENIGTTLEGIGTVYGGANQANIGATGTGNESNITLNINSGMVANVFGGNNISGSIFGTITVTIEKTSDACGWYVGNVFGAGNQAQYTGSPAVNIKNGTVSGNVYGGGMGLASDHTKGQVTGNPVVTIGDNNVNGHTATVSGDVYGGGDAGNVVGTPQVNVINKCNTSIGNVYGGGNAADVNGTDVNIDGGVITGDVFGGGHGDKASLGSGHSDKVANVNGNVSVTITGGTIYRVFAGSNINGSISGTNNTLEINKSTTAACDMKIGEVYGGGNMANGNATSISVGCTGTLTTQASNPGQIGVTLEGIGAVYGGANNADIGTSSNNSNITLDINSGMVANVFGGNNQGGIIYGTIQVNIEKTSDACGWYVGNVYGAGNMAAYTGSPLVNIKNGTVSQNVYGGGKGNTAVVTGAPVVTIGDSNASHVAIVTGDVYGGGDAAAVNGNTSVTYDDSNTSSSVGQLFGGGNAAGVTGTATVAMANGKVDTGIYGGCNSTGNIGGKITVNVNGGTLGSLTNLQQSTPITVDVFGGGFGESTSTSGDVEVNINGGDIYGDVYGGSALGQVNDAAADKTTVNILDGTLHSVVETITGGFKVYHGGNVFGGGLGQAGAGTKGQVNGEIIVNIGSGTVDTSGDYIGYTTTPNIGNATIEGNVYGCNNTNGSPQQNVTVNIFKTAHVAGTNTIDDPGFAIANVFGGGNEADYTATGKTATVNIYGCDNTIWRTFGGGNAAAAPHVVTFIQGGHIYQVFGGGNGERGQEYAANITEGVSLQIHGGNVEQFFGGSNQNGAITGGISTTADSNGPCGGMEVDEFFCGGNFADITGNVVTTIYCSQGMEVHNLYGGCNQANITGNVVLNVEGGIYQYVYGGSKGDLESLGGQHHDKQANISGTVTLNLYGGTIENVFGGSNINGNIGGSITVNVLDIESTTCPLYITNIYGGSNLTSYEPNDATITSPVVNVVHAKYGISGNVYGGSKGAAGGTTNVGSNPLVNIGYDADMNGYITPTSSYLTDHSALLAAPRAIISGSVFGGGDAAKVTGNTAIFLRNRAKVFGNVYGGGNMGEVTGDTKVIVNGANE